MNDNMVHADIETLVLDPRNARKGDLPSIAASLSEFGQHRPAVAQRSTMKVIAGNHLVMAAESLGWTKVWVYLVEDDDEQAVRRAIADNAVGDQARWDDDQLRSLLEEVGTDVPGVDDKMIARLFKDLDIEKKDDPKFPIMARPGEKYPYIVFFGESEMDEMFLKTLWPERERSWKRPDTAPVWSRIRPMSELRKLLGPEAGL